MTDLITKERDFNTREEIEEGLENGSITYIPDLIPPEYHPSIHQLDVDSGEIQYGKYVIGIIPLLTLVKLTEDYNLVPTSVTGGSTNDALEVPVSLLKTVADKRLQWDIKGGKLIPRDFQLTLNLMKTTLLELISGMRKAKVTNSTQTGDESLYWEQGYQVAKDYLNGGDDAAMIAEANARGDGITLNDLANKIVDKRNKYVALPRVFQGLQKRVRNNMGEASNFSEVVEMYSKLENDIYRIVKEST